jgi:DMSO/TMAO reductase YedYZ molybdopterin-dependent catalytic subunit
MKKLIQTSIAAITAVLIISGFLVTTVFSQESVSRGDLAWKISVVGAVSNHLQLTLAELIEMPRTTVEAELSCYGQPLAEGEWTGVKLWSVLEEAGINDMGGAVTFKAQDGYEIQDFPFTEATRSDVILAYELDGVPLPETIRLVVPNANGNVWIKLITQITVQEASSSTSSGNTVAGQQEWTPPHLFSQSAPPTSEPASVQTSLPALNASVPQQRDPTSSPSPVEDQKVAEPTAPIDYSYVLVVVAVLAAGIAAGIVIVKRRKAVRP